MVVRHEVTYVSSLTFGFEPVSIECWVTEIRAASFTMAYEVFEEDEAGERTVFLRARTVLTPYVFATERPRRLHPEERESLGRLLEPGEPVRPPAAPQVVDVPGTPLDLCWHVTTLAPDRRSAAAGSLRHFLGTPEAMKLLRAPGAGVPPSRFRPPVYVTIWS